MASSAINSARHGAGDVVAALIGADGSARHRYVGSDELAESPSSTRNLADAAHFLCLLHGRYPGVVDLSAERIVHPAGRAWMYQAAAGFTVERAFLTRLVVAAGPLPSTLGQAQSEAAVAGQTHALATLARSDRNGTALGAAVALVLDWRAIRLLLDAAADRFGIQPPPLDLPGSGECLDLLGRIAETPAIERAVAFGAQQMLLQHRGLWDLLETREMARRKG